MPDDLTPVEQSVLLILMAEAREVPNAYLTNERKVELKAPGRNKLKARGLIAVREEKRRFYVELTDSGWRWCRRDWPMAPAKTSSVGSALYAVMAGVCRYLDQAGVSLGDVFAPQHAPAAEAAGNEMVSLTSADIEARIRKVYGALAPRPGAPIKLAALRSTLGSLPRADVDRVLVQMNRAPDVSIVPESNQKTLTNEDRAAAVSIGNQQKHVISIG